MSTPWEKSLEKGRLYNLEKGKQLKGETESDGFIVVKKGV